MELIPQNSYRKLMDFADQIGLETFTPPEISGPIRDICQKISPGQVPVFLPTQPIQKADGLMGDCFINVDCKIQEDGGTAEYGWVIWQTRWIFDCEYHAVWRNPDGELQDVSPPYQEKDKRILFLPDPKTVYRGEMVLNRLFPRYQGKDVDRLLFCLNELNRMRCGKTPCSPARYSEFQSRMWELIRRLDENHAKPVSVPRRRARRRKR